MVGDEVLRSLLVFDLHVKFLEEKHPPDKSRFRTLLGHQILDCGMTGVDDGFVTDDIGPEFVKGKNHGNELLFGGGVVDLGIVESADRIVYCAE